MSGKLPIIIYDFEKGRQKQVRIIVIVKLKLSCQKLFYKKKKINKNKKKNKSDKIQPFHGAASDDLFEKSTKTIC